MDANYIPYFEKYFLEELNEQEVLAFEKKLKEDGTFRKAYEQFLNSISEEQGLVQEEVEDFDLQASWEAIDHQLFDAEITRKSSDSKFPTFLKWAASFVLIGILSFSFYQILLEGKSQGPERLTKKTSFGQKTTLTLSDGTVVKLNSGSKLIYPSYFSDSLRVVELEGEAFFDVTRNPESPFLIKTATLTTQVLGTSFNVFAFAEDTVHEVAVKTGEVKVFQTDEPDNLVFLNPGRKAVFDNLSLEMSVETSSIENIGNWSEGFLFFDNERLDVVFDQLSKWYGVEFEIENPEVLSCRVTLKQRDENLKNILNIIKFATNINFQFNGEKVTISGSSCQS